MTWSIADLADAVSSTLQEEAARLDAEHAVRGIDALDECALHPLLAAGLAAAGYGVERERRYPFGRRARRESEGDRCDLVLAPPGQSVAASESRATLFEPPAAAPDEALFWMEVKVAAQFSEVGANQSWSSDLVTRPRRDLGKLAAEPGIHHRGLLLILFAAAEAVIDHDLAVAIDRFTEAGAPIGFPSVRTFALQDRIGHRIAATALLPVGEGRLVRSSPQVGDADARPQDDHGDDDDASGAWPDSPAARDAKRRASRAAPPQVETFRDPTFEPLPGAELTGDDFWESAGG